MDLTGEKTDQEQQVSEQQGNQIEQFEQMYVGSTLMVDGEPEEIEDASITQEGIELQTANHEYKIVIDQ